MTTGKKDAKNFWFSWEPAKILNSKRVALLSLEEEGAYRRALDYCMLHGSVPRDPEKLARLIGKGCKKKVAAAILPLFIDSEKYPEEVEHETVNEKIKEAAEVRERKVEAGKKSAEKRQQNANRTATEPQQEGNRTPTDTPTDTPTESQQEPNRTATEGQQNTQQEGNRIQPYTVTVTVTDTDTKEKNTYVPPARGSDSSGKAKSFASNDREALRENAEKLEAEIAQHLPKNFHDVDRATILLRIFVKKKGLGPRKVWDDFDDFAKNFKSWMPYALKHEPEQQPDNNSGAPTTDNERRPVLGKISKAGARDFLAAGTGDASAH